MSGRDDPLTPRWVSDDLARLRERGLFRRRELVRRRRPGHVEIDGQEYLDFGSNDYLGLAADPRVRKAAQSALEEGTLGSAASPLVSGYHAWHARLEEELALFEEVQAVVLFSSGFAANVGILSALAGEQDIVFCEKRNHASLVDGCRLSGAALRVFRSDQLDKLERRLARTTPQRRRVIVTDSVFSMDGDPAPLPDLCDLAERFEAVLYVDEAHAIGVLGSHGRGLAELTGTAGRIPLRLGTLGKAMGVAGGFLISNREWADWVVNHARSYIYSTAVPPACAAAACQALRILQAEPERQARLLEHARNLRDALAQAGWAVGDSPSPIIPIIAGEPQEALGWSRRLRHDGFWCPAIRPPTVPVGTSRLRVTVNAALEAGDLAGFVESMCKARS